MDTTASRPLIVHIDHAEPLIAAGVVIADYLSLIHI